MVKSVEGVVVVCVLASQQLTMDKLTRWTTMNGPFCTKCLSLVSARDLPASRDAPNGFVWKWTCWAGLDKFDH